MPTSHASSELDFLAGYPDLAREWRDVEATANPLPNASLSGARAFIELLLRRVAERCGQTQKTGEEDLCDFINRLRDTGCIPRAQADIFHAIRIPANKVVHREREATTSDALRAMDQIRSLVTWFKSSARQSPKIAPTFIGSAARREEPARSVKTQTNIHPFPNPTVAVRQKVGTAPSPTSDQPAPDAWRNPFVILPVALIVVMTAISVWMWTSPSASTPAPSPVTQAAMPIQYFGQSQTYTVAPEDGVSPVNVRSSPNSENNDNWTGALMPGTEVTGVGSTQDAQGGFWILLENNRGYVSAPLLRPLPPTPMQPVQALPPNDADSGNQGDNSDTSTNKPTVTPQEGTSPDQDVQSQPRQ